MPGMMTCKFGILNRVVTLLTTARALRMRMRIVDSSGRFS